MPTDPPSEIPPRYRGPGLMDLQLNGFAGFDFNSDPALWDLEALRHVRDRLRARGILAAFPTLITDEPGAMLARVAAWSTLVDQDPELAETFPRLHIEGPFISPEDGPRGAHPRAYCRTPQDLPDFLDHLRKASRDRIGVFTLAPECVGALALIERLRDAGIVPALGHTQATANRIAEAVAAGARLSTHLGNGSHQMLPRLDNYVQAQLAEDALWATFIPDGHHVPFFTLKSFLRAKTVRRSILVTDAISAADMGPGRYRLGNAEVVVDETLRAARPGEPNLAGSALTLDRGVLNVARHAGVCFADAWAMASTHPARLVGLPGAPEVCVEIGPAGFTRRPA